MLVRKITTSGNSAALTLSQDVLGLMGLSVGDEVELDLVGRTLMVRPLDEARRQATVASATDRVLQRRKKLMDRLAEGAGSPRRKR
jgi:antitoxin component of MazEF toxin-antitoxin module